MANARQEFWQVPYLTKKNLSTIVSNSPSSIAAPTSGAQPQGQHASPFKVTSSVILREAAQWRRASCPRSEFASARVSSVREGDVGTC